MASPASQLQAQLETVLAAEPASRVVALRMESGHGLPEAVHVRGHRFDVRWCESRLAMREALVEERAGDGAGLLLVTPLPDTALPADVAARVTRARIFQARDWELVRPLFSATSVDARLGRVPWMAQALIDLGVHGPYSALPSRFLDLDTAWREFLSRSLGLRAARPDALELLAWTMEPDGEVRFAGLDATVQRDVLKWFEQECGPIGQLVAAATRSGRRSDAVPVALVCGVLFSPGEQRPPELAAAAVRLERNIGDHHVSATEAAAWATEAQRLVAQQDADRMRPALERADALLRELRVAEHARIGRHTPLALEQRLEDYADALLAHARDPSPSTMGAVEQCATDVLAHTLAASRSMRADRVLMARRLARWLVQDSVAPRDYVSMVAWQADVGAFVDWARFRLLGGDEQPALSDAYAALRQAVASRRDALNQRFCDLLDAVNRENRWEQGRALPLERVLDTIVAPLMANQGVLLLVMDGLSLSIFRDLLSRPEQYGWREIVDPDRGRAWVGMATLPTITESSRASLLCGTLRTATPPQEKVVFASHPALLGASSKKGPPQLFQKGDLLDESGLAVPLRAAVADAGRRVVGVVYNAVDDHLSGPDQLHQSWHLEQLRGLLPLLQAAREARRVVVLTADHGHVLEEGSSAIKGGDSDRWRPFDGAPLSPGEKVYEGGRVAVPGGDRRAVCLVTETLRYTGRKNGYHGGATLQELCVPLSVFAPFGVEVDGWVDAAPAVPEWWELPLVAQPPVVAERPRPARKTARRNELQPSLFAGGIEPERSVDAGGDWISALLASPVYAAQKQMAARVAHDDALIRALLTALDERGGRLGFAALAQRIAKPELRIVGVLTIARRVLNVDQASVLEWDETSRSVTLNRPLLEQQFGIARR